MTTVHDHDPVGHGHGLFLVVRDVDECDPDLVLNPLQLELHFLAQLEVERAERLVEEEHARPVHERPGKRDPLLLSARELPWLAALEPRETDELKRFVDPRAQLAFLDAATTQPEGDVLEDREVREERIRLEDRVHVALVGRQRRHVDSPELDASLGGLLEAADHPQRRRLATARWPEEREEVAALDVERDVVDGDDVVEALRQPDQADVVVGRRSGRRRCRSFDGQCSCSHASASTSPRMPVISSNSA